MKTCGERLKICRRTRMILIDGMSYRPSKIKIALVTGRVSVQGVESLWGDCRFIPADWGS